MQSQKPAVFGVKLFAWLNIIGGILMMLMGALGLLVSIFMISVMKSLGFSLFDLISFFFVMPIIMIIIGRNLLRFNEWARKWYIIFSAVSFIYSLPLFFRHDFNNLIFLSMLMFSTVFIGACICFFMLPEVKILFKKS